MRLIERSPQHPVDAALYPKGQRTKAWFEAMLDCGVIQPDGHNYLVKTQMFFDHRDKLWAKVHERFLERLSASVLAVPYQLTSSTSKSAAQSMVTEAPSLRQRLYVLLCAEEHTDYESSVILARSENSVRPRRVELSALELVEAVGTRTGPSGRAATVWRGIK